MADHDAADRDGAPTGDEPKLPEFKLDANQARGFISCFNRLPKEANIVRFFDRKDYYTVHGDNASFIATTYYRTTAVVRLLGSGHEALPSVTVSRSMFETILRDLLLEQTDYTVEVYEGAGSNWQRTKTASPGMLDSFEDVLYGGAYEMQETPVIMALRVSVRERERTVGLAYCDTTQRVIGLADFVDDDQYNNLESVLVALNCRECLIPQEANSPDQRRLHDVIKRCGAHVTTRKRGEFVARDAERDLTRLIKGNVAQHRAVLDSEPACAAVSVLLHHTALLGDDANHNKYRLHQYALGQYMRLDATALRALNVMESRADANKSFSLYGLMNRTVTAGMGKRLLHRWLKQPLLDVEQITERHDVVEAFTRDSEVRRELRDEHLKRVHDIERLARKLERRRSTLQDIVKLYQASIRIPFIRKVLARYEGDHAALFKTKYIDELADVEGSDHLGKYEQLVEAAIDIDQIEHGEYLISPNYDTDLADIKAERDGVDTSMRRCFSAAAEDLDLIADKTIKLDKTPLYGWVFRVSKKEEMKVRKALEVRYQRCGVRKDGVLFTNRELKQLSEKHTRLSDEYTAKQKNLVVKVVDVAATFVPLFERIAAVLAELDVLAAFADLALSAPIPYVRPSVTPQGMGDIVLKGSRHPCVEVQDDVAFIANDCELVRGESWFQIITGPNMGGKSTYIRQVAVNVLMAQVGSFVPCDSASISVRDCIFARVGAGDCQLRGVSTFMAEMLETASILKAATSSSLVIIDELGRGTSTYDGFGLAWAISEHLAAVIKAPTLFATHFHELTALANPGATVPGPDGAVLPVVGVANYHVSAHTDENSRRLTMLYKVQPGPCDQSFGIHVAEFAHFPESVIALAKRKAAELEDFSSPHNNNNNNNNNDTNISDADADIEPGSKRKRVSCPSESASGAVRIKKFLADFATIPLNQMSKEEGLARVRELKAGLDVDAAGNAWLTQLLQRGMQNA